MDTTKKVLDAVSSALKPAVDVALPITKQAGEEALKIASPAISEATKKAQEAIQSTGVDIEKVATAGKVWLSLSFFLLSKWQCLYVRLLTKFVARIIICLCWC